MIVNSSWSKNLFLVGFWLIASVTFAQDIAFKSSNFKEDKTGLKLAKENIEIADEMRDEGIVKILAFQEDNLLFIQAIFHYQKAQDFNPNNAELNYKIGSSYLFTNQKEKAAEYLIRAKELNSDLPSARPPRSRPPPPTTPSTSSPRPRRRPR